MARTSSTARLLAPAVAESPDAAVRRLAGGLAAAIAAARAAGYVVDAPFRADALARIAISETAAVGRTGRPLPGQPTAMLPAATAPEIPAPEVPAPEVPEAGI